MNRLERTRQIVRALSLLSVGTLTACDKDPAATTTPDAAAVAPAEGKKGGECLHSEGCCGGHTEGDGSCGADAKAPAPGPSGDAAAQTWDWTVEPGKFAEITVQLGAGAKMVASFSTDGAPVAWNVHSHPGNKAVVHAEGTAQSGEPEHTADAAGMYSFLWKNEGESPVRVSVKLRIEGQGTVHSTHP